MFATIHLPKLAMDKGGQRYNILCQFYASVARAIEVGVWVGFQTWLQWTPKAKPLIARKEVIKHRGKQGKETNITVKSDNVLYLPHITLVLNSLCIFGGFYAKDIALTANSLFFRCIWQLNFRNDHQDKERGYRH